jgi:hypothetical protein
VTGLLPAAGLHLNPDAAHPPFAWQIALPTDWAFLDTHPASWQRSRERLVDDRFAGQRVKSADRRQVLGFLDELVASCQRAGTLISLVHLGRLPGGEAVSAGLQLAWYDSTPQPASLAWVRQAAGRQGVIEEIDTPAGTALVQHDHLSLAPPGSTTRVGLRSLQVFRPLPGRTWTAVVATAGAHPDMMPLLRDLIVTVAGSIQPTDDQPTSEEPTRVTEYRAEVDYTPVPPPQAPGIQRGFGTLLIHHINPEKTDAEEHRQKGGRW